MATDTKSAWFPFGTGPQQTGIRVFCLPYAGGGASVFLPWRKKAPSNASIVPVQFPGRETRLAEPSATEMAPLVASLAEAIAAEDEAPFALFGYSMGAKLAYNLIHYQLAHGLRLPEKLLVAAHRAPDAPPHRPGVGRLPDLEFSAYLRELGGTPEQVLNDPDLSRLLLPILKADFNLLEQNIASGPVPVPIFAYAGLEDSAASPVAMQHWGRFSTREFSLRIFPGGHFFHQTAEDLVSTLCHDASLQHSNEQNGSDDSIFKDSRPQRAALA